MIRAEWIKKKIKIKIMLALSVWKYIIKWEESVAYASLAEKFIVRIIAVPQTLSKIKTFGLIFAERYKIFV